jgi:tetratricopeptide (TPR) repeat protein
MKKQLFLTLLFFCIISISNAFNKNSDSLIEASKSLQGKQKIIVLNKISNSLINVDPLQAIKYATEAYKLSKSIKDRKEEAISLINIAYANEDIGNYKIAIYNYEIALDIVTDLKIDYLNGYSAQSLPPIPLKAYH